MRFNSQKNGRHSVQKRRKPPNVNNTGDVTPMTSRDSLVNRYTVQTLYNYVFDRLVRLSLIILTLVVFQFLFGQNFLVYFRWNFLWEIHYFMNQIHYHCCVYQFALFFQKFNLRQVALLKWRFCDFRGKLTRQNNFPAVSFIVVSFQGIKLLVHALYLPDRRCNFDSYFLSNFHF